MYKSLENLFEAEFKRATAISSRYKNIYEIEIPSGIGKESKKEAYLIKGVTDKDFMFLNGMTAYKFPSNFALKRRSIDKRTRKFARGEDGKFKYESFSVPQGSMVVIADVGSQDIPFERFVHFTGGFGFVDFKKGPNSTDYIYIVPKANLYGASQTALAMSVKHMKNYSGMGYVTWDNGVIYLHVIPYRPGRKYVGTRILKTKIGTTVYSREISEIISFWESKGIVPALGACVMADGTNIALRPTEVGYDGFSPYDLLAVGDKELYGDEDKDFADD